MQLSGLMNRSPAVAASARTHGAAGVVPRPISAATCRQQALRSMTVRAGPEQQGSPQVSRSCSTPSKETPQPQQLVWQKVLLPMPAACFLGSWPSL